MRIKFLNFILLCFLLFVFQAIRVFAVQEFIQLKPEKKTVYVQTYDGCTLVVWEENTSNSKDIDIVAQKFGAGGIKLWGENNISIALFRGNQKNPVVVPLPDGGAYVIWQSDSAGENNINLWCQRLLPNGNKAWRTPVPVCVAAGNQINPSAAKDDEENLLIVWEDYRKGNADIYGQRIGLDGSPLGVEGGVAIEIAPGNQTDAQFNIDSNGAPASIFWNSHRNGFAEPIRIETDLSLLPIPEPALFFFLPIIILLRRIDGLME